MHVCKLSQRRFYVEFSQFITSVSDGLTFIFNVRLIFSLSFYCSNKKGSIIWNTFQCWQGRTDHQISATLPMCLTMLTFNFNLNILEFLLSNSFLSQMVFFWGKDIMKYNFLPLESYPSRYFGSLFLIVYLKLFKM